MKPSEADPFALFPSFRAAFEKGREVHCYLEFLNLSAVQEDIEEAVDVVRSAANNSPDLDGEIERLFAEPDWRPHLVAAVAILVGRSSPASVSALWGALDRGSWVTPQLAVVAFMRDPRFAENAAKRLAAQCPVDMAQLDGFSALERHVMTGPSDAEARSVKALSALSFLYKQLPHPDAKVLAFLDSPETRKLLKSDDDRGDRIAQRWLVDVEKQVLSR